MKKFLLSCFLALGISSSAQYSYTGDFENPGYNTTIYKQFGGGSQTAGAACQGAFGGQLLPTAAITQTGFMVDLSTIGQTNNGQRIDFRVSYKKAAGVAGTIQPAYFIFNAATNQWSINFVGSPVTLTTAELTTCSTLIASVPTGAIQPGAVGGIGAWFIKSGAGNAGIFLDDILINQDNTVTTAPACTTITAPVDGSTISAGTGTITWNAVPTAVNYKVKVGTTSGGSELFSGTVAGTSLNISLAKSTPYYASVVPSNAIGDAQSCGEISFTTNTTVAYCGGITASATVYPLSSVTLNGVTKTSAATTGSPAYEDFTSTVFNVVTGTSYNLTAIGTGLGTNVFAMAAFIDWNEDGDFNDANEKYFQNAPFVSGSGNSINLSGSIAVPSGATPGTKRMRVKYNFQGGGVALQPTLTDPCANMTNGQTEDYSVSVTMATVAPACTAFTAPTNLSTNFPANGLMTWAPAATASGYKLYVGTTPNGTEILNGVIVNATSYQVSLVSGTMYYAKVVPFNAIGDAQSCTEISFTAAAVVYCTAGATNTSFEKISNVTLGSVINNSSTSTAGYENFTALPAAPVNRNSSYAISVANTEFDSDETFVWIDYNQDGNFDDVTEKVTLTPAAIATGTITIPNTAKLGNTRMRVRMSYTLNGHNTNSCGTSLYGQVEDYTLEIGETLATAAVTKSTVSVYPNPFQDVLNISDVKGVKSISISDMSGRQVKVMAPSATLQVSDLKTGLYIVNLNMEDGSVRSIKAIKK